MSQIRIKPLEHQQYLKKRTMPMIYYRTHRSVSYMTNMVKRDLNTAEVDRECKLKTSLHNSFQEAVGVELLVECLVAACATQDLRRPRQFTISTK